MTEEQFVKLFGKKTEFMRQIAKTFFIDPQDPKTSAEGKFLNTDISWVQKDQRANKRNVWEVIRNLFKQISNDKEITNSTRHRFDEISLDQLLLFISLSKLRNFSVFYFNFNIIKGTKRNDKAE